MFRIGREFEELDEILNWATLGFPSLHGKGVDLDTFIPVEGKNSVSIIIHFI